jgi:membrane protease subunit (stomatin/prohibitin family)
VVWTGHGLHLYWLFHEPVPASLEIECYLKGIAKELCADPAAAEIAHVMRIPGTLNYKIEDNVVAAEFIEVKDRRYTICDFEPWKIANEHQNTNTKVEFTESIVDVDIYKFALTTKIINLIKGEWRQYGY